jgi:hypothetical protein
VNDKPAEILLYDFLLEQFEAAPAGSILSLEGDSDRGELDLHDTIYQQINTQRCVRISEVVGGFSPGPENEWKEYDVSITLVALARVTGTEKKDRQPALTQVWELQKELYKLLTEEPTLDGRVCDLLLEDGVRGYDELDSEPYAVVNIPVIINPSGARYAKNT